MTSRLLGLVRDQVLALLFGAGHAMDAFNVAFRIPNLVRDLFAEGAMSAAFVPAFTRQLTLSGKDPAWRLGCQVMTALIAATGILVAAGILFAEPLTAALASEYAAVPGKLELTVRLTRIMLPFLTLVAVAAALMGMLNALHRFFIPALSPAMFNVATILCAVALVPFAEPLGIEPITAIAIGTILGGIGQIVVQWPALAREGFRYRPMLDLRDPGLREVLALMGPGTLGLAATQVNLVVNTVLATGEGEGAVSYLSFAFRLMYLPIGLFGVSIATAAVPAISRHAAREDFGGMRETLSSSLRLMLMLSVPATIGLVVLAEPIVRLIFERGRFSPADTAATAAALRAYAPGLLGYSAVKLAVPSFYALRDSRTPVTVSFGVMVLNIVLNVTLVRLLGYWGLALGTGLAALANALVLLLLLRDRLAGLDGRRVLVASAKITIASLFMGGVTYLVEPAIAGAFAAPTLIAQLASVSAAIAAGLIALLVAARALRIQEFDEAMHQLVGRFIGRFRA
jgi:putative peptidoglycan lipid II flippase